MTNFPIFNFFIGIAAVLFFFAAVSVTFIPNPTAWGFVFFALGHLGNLWTTKTA